MYCPAKVIPEHRSPEAYQAIIAAPATHIVTDEALRIELFEKTFETSACVFDCLMQTAKMYKLSDPTFFNTLDKASRIHNQGLRHKKTPEEKALAAAEKELAEAKKKQQKADGLSNLEIKRQQEAEQIRLLLQEIEATTKAVVFASENRMEVVG